MNRTAIRSAALHVKLGSGYLLLFADAVLLALVAYDLRQAHRLGMLYPFLSRPLNSLLHFDPSLILDSLALLALPILIGYIVNFVAFKHTPNLYRRLQFAPRLNTCILIFHICVVIVCTAHSNAIGELENSSGLCGPIASAAFCFSSGLTLLMRHQWTIGVAVAFVSVAFRLLRGHELLSEFEFWRLMGASGEYQPVHGDEIVYFNNASMAPSIHGISATTETQHHQYQKLVPTSDDARNFLVRKANAARSALYSYLLETNDQRTTRELDIEFFPGTSRALEAGILRTADIAHVVLSQYEHPSQADVVRWVCNTKQQIGFTALSPPSAAFFRQPWESQLDDVCDGVTKALDRVSGRAAIILSEVHYITGTHVRVEEAIRRLRDLYPTRLVFIVDGSQAVGNLARPFRDFASALTGDDFYYFSAHKWLLSPNTCGVLVSRTGGGKTQRVPYDMFGYSLPTSTIDPNTVLGLSSALDFLFDDRKLFDRFCAISRESKEYFRSLVEQASQLELVQSATPELNASLFLAVKPKPGYRWNLSRTLFWDDMRRIGMDLTVIPEEPPHFNPGSGTGANSEYMLRISFPYFLIGRNIRALASQLHASMSKLGK